MKLWAVALLAACGRSHFDDHAVDAPADTAADADLSALLAGCVLHMPMDEAAWTGAPGEVRDGCGGHHGTAIGGATTAVDEVRGTVGQFVAGTSCVEVADAPDLRAAGALTVSAWIDPTALAPASFGVVSKRVDFQIDTEYSVFVWTDTNGTGSTNQLYVDLDTENDRVADPAATFLDGWKQVTVVYDGSLGEAQRVRFYVDGELSYVAPESSPSIGTPATEPPLYIGCLPLTGPAQSFVGRIDEVAVWMRALPATDVAMWYAATKR